MKSIEEILKQIEEQRELKLLKEKQEQDLLLEIQNKQKLDHYNKTRLYENSLMNSAVSNPSSAGGTHFTDIPQEFFITTSAESSKVKYFTKNTFKTFDLKENLDPSVDIQNSNEVLRNGKDFYFVGNFGTVSTYFIKLTNCELKNGEYFHYDKIEYKNINSLITIVHGSCYYKGYVYLSSRDTTTPTLARVDVSNINNITTLTLPMAAFNGRRTTDIIGYRDNVYIMPSVTGGTASIVRASLDLATYSVVLNTGLAATNKRVRTGAAFLLYNDEIFIPMINNVAAGFNHIGLEVYNMSGVLQRSVYGLTVSTGGSFITPLAHWMTVFNNKLIMSNAIMSGTMSNRCLIRMDVTTLALEESIPMDVFITDDNSIFSDGYMYLNGENPAASVTASVPPKLLKIKYNDFTDKTVLYDSFPSYGSLNPTSFII